MEGARSVRLFGRPPTPACRRAGRGFAGPREATVGRPPPRKAIDHHGRAPCPGSNPAWAVRRRRPGRRRRFRIAPRGGRGPPPRTPRARRAPRRRARSGAALSTRRRAGAPAQGRAEDERERCAARDVLPTHRPRRLARRDLEHQRVVRRGHSADEPQEPVAADQGAGEERRHRGQRSARRTMRRVRNRSCGVRELPGRSFVAQGAGTCSLGTRLAATLRTIVRLGSRVAVPVISSPWTTCAQTPRKLGRSNSDVQRP